MLALRMRDGPLAGERFDIEGEVVVGRTNADITIEDPLISRRHAVVRAVDSVLEIEDLGSLNGTVVNSETLSAPRRLEPGDVIMVGATTIEVVGEPSTGSRTVAGPGPRPGITVPPAPPPPAAEPADLVGVALPHVVPAPEAPQPSAPEAEPTPEPATPPPETPAAVVEAPAAPVEAAAPPQPEAPAQA